MNHFRPHPQLRSEIQGSDAPKRTFVHISSSLYLIPGSFSPTSFIKGYVVNFPHPADTSFCVADGILIQCQSGLGYTK